MSYSGRHRIYPGGKRPGRPGGENGLAVTDEAVEKATAVITSGALRAGGPLPREAGLAAGLSLSRHAPRVGQRPASVP